MKNLLKKIQLYISKLGKKLLEFIKKTSRYAKKHPRHTMATIAVLVIIISIGIYTILLNLKPKTITTTPYPFAEITTYKLNAIPNDIKYGKLSSELRKFPADIGVYLTKEKPLTGLQKNENLQKILNTLGFTSSARNYSNKEAITYYEKGKSLSVTLIGDKISFSTGLNVEPELLTKDDTIRSRADILQTGKYFFENYELMLETQFSDPKEVFSKMGELGLYEINNVEQADVITYIFQPQIEALSIVNSEFLPYVSLTKNGKIVALKMFNKKIASATKNPVMSLNKLKNAIKNNEAVLLDKVPSKYLNPQSIIVKNTKVLYYYNEKQEVLSPVISLLVTLKQGNEEQEATLYLPAFESKYYY